MRRIAELMFIAGVLATTCCGCRFCGTDFDPNRPEMRTSVVSKE